MLAAPNRKTLRRDRGRENMKAPAETGITCVGISSEGLHEHLIGTRGDVLRTIDRLDRSNVKKARAPWRRAYRSLVIEYGDECVSKQALSRTEMCIRWSIRTLSLWPGRTARGSPPFPNHC